MVDTQLHRQANLKFKVFGNRFVCDYADYSGGISNSTATNFTVPVAALTNISNLHPIYYKNNGTNSATIGNLQCYASSKTISAWTTFYHGTWVAANGKDIYFSNLSFNF